MGLGDAVTGIKGVGGKKAVLLGRLGIKSVRDLLYYMPRGYESQGSSVKISALKEDETYNITARIAKEPVLRRIKKGLSLVTFTLQDETGRTEAVFFNQPYIRNMYKSGDTVYVFGKTKRVGRNLQFTNPHIEKEGRQSEGLMAVYPLTMGLTQKVMRLIMREALDKHCGSIPDLFTNDFRAEHNLAEINFALSNVHFPENEASLELAKRRLIFEELLLFNIALLSHESEKEDSAHPMKCGPDLRQQFLERISFRLTNAQLRVMSEIEGDLAGTKPMNRLLQGDVGSGKTIPAFYAMHICIQNGFQCVMMAPTEVLSRQHFENAQRVFPGVNIELLTGSTPSAQRRAAYENIAGGLTDIVIGTHAVLYDNVQFARLGLVITDEQHRFGVGQRALLETKSKAPHILIMSATPIPRTLALILYGKTDMSIIDEMPPGRTPVATFCVPEAKRSDMYGFIEKEIAGGSQVFVVCPVIEQSEENGMRSSEEVYELLKKRFKRVALLHGRMSAAEKNETLKDFRDKHYDILVSTTVIEVGIDIPDATIMVIENAERFGLAQLHQLRGRVGRGVKRSYCFLMYEGADNERLKILTKTNDGYKIAEEDLRLRGPGEYLGSKQSGVSDLYMANLIRDMKLLKETQQIAKDLSRQNKELYRVLERAARSRFDIKFEQTAVN
jgi:ATP-dependent DNA helicase RecG